MNWINVKDKLPEEGEVVHFLSIASAGTTRFEKGRFEYDRRTEEFASVAGMGTPDRVEKWAKRKK